jgi:hypothetical protein
VGAAALSEWAREVAGESFAFGRGSPAQCRKRHSDDLKEWPVSLTSFSPGRSTSSVPFQSAATSGVPPKVAVPSKGEGGSTLARLGRVAGPATSNVAALASLLNETGAICIPRAVPPQRRRTKRGSPRSIRTSAGKR